MIKPLPQATVKSIKKNISSILQGRDVSKLNKATYELLGYVTSGFIAHYDRMGFIGYYEDSFWHFVSDLENSADVQNPERYLTDSYFSQGVSKEYYAQKADLYQYIKDELERFEK